MSLFSRLFGGAKDPLPEPETYEGFTITPTPIKEGQRFRLSARIEKDGRTHTLIRADVVEDIDTANTISTAKARQMIDEQGDRLFG